MKKISCIILSVLALALASCSVKEIRDDCPSYLDVTVLYQDASVFPEGEAWSHIYELNGYQVERTLLDGMDRRDTTVTYLIVPRRNVAVVTTNVQVESGRVTAAFGEEFYRLYAARKDADCTGEEAFVTMEHQYKQFCVLTVRLSEASLPYLQGLYVQVDAPYDGLSFPDFTAHEGPFRCGGYFNPDGTISFILPRQGGEGLSLKMGTDGVFTASYDLYEYMRESGYDWDALSLDDYEIVVNLNSLTFEIEIVDWSIEEVGGHTFN